ncbi:MAG: family metallo-hydrolase, partial [Solirubrobacteraceae bacterium]|nr:family metallo-hydrolase [Solirubrobacteraceae bacterium]
VQVPRVTGDERAVMERFAELAAARGLDVSLDEHDLAALRVHPAHPGEETARTELVGVTGRAPGRDAAAPRLCLNGHLDVVEVGTEAWRHGPWSGLVADGVLHGRGSADMTGAVTAAMHAAAAIGAVGGAVGEVVVQAVASEEDGGLGTFAALQADAAFGACLISEPTGFDVACAQAGALTFSGVVPGVAAHAALRLGGVSAIDRYLPIHAALAALEAELNAEVDHPLMRELPLAYPLSVGRVSAGLWSSSVPDRLEFEGRVGVPVGTDPAVVRERLEAAVRAACPEAAIGWTGGAFAPGETSVDHPFAHLVLAATGDELGRPARAVGVTYGADMRQFCARGIPCVMVGTPGLDQAHTVDEHVSTDDLVALARLLVRVIARF